MLTSHLSSSRLLWHRKYTVVDFKQLIRKALIHPVPSNGTENNTAYGIPMSVGTSETTGNGLPKYLLDVIQTIYPFYELNRLGLKII